ncbi:hypothetical protein PXY30_004452 [Salmonella enterica]|nr:hypothetical protein [Salmonella enterica]
MASYRMVGNQLVIREPKRSPVDGLTKAERRQMKRAAKVVRTEPAAEQKPTRKAEPTENGYSRQRVYADFTLSGMQHLRDF